MPNKKLYMLIKISNLYLLNNIKIVFNNIL